MPLTAAAFAPYGEVLEASGEADLIINQGNCGRWHDRAALDFDPNGRAGISIFKARPRSLPYTLALFERHPLGSQAFIPMAASPYLVCVASDESDKPVAPRAFLASPGQGINIGRNVWHGVLTPLGEPGLFAVVDRIGPGDNLVEHRLADPLLVAGP
nr:MULTISPECIES: ureidoglycolate lyase [unclassified Roseitalea]